MRISARKVEPTAYAAPPTTECALEASRTEACRTEALQTVESPLPLKDELSALGCTLVLFALIGTGVVLNEMDYQETLHLPAAASSSAGSSAPAATSASASGDLASPRGSDAIKEAQAAREFVSGWFA